MSWNMTYNIMCIASTFSIIEVMVSVAGGLTNVIAEVVNMVEGNVATINPQ